MKKNRVLRLAVLCLVLASASIGQFGFTQAKYVSSATVTASGSVAKFDVVVNDEHIAQAAGQVFQLTVPVSLVGPGGLKQPIDGIDYNAIWGANGSAPGPNHGTTTISSTTGSIIAPGTGGTIVLNFENHSEVRVRFKLDSATSAVTFTGGLSTSEIQFSRVAGSAEGITPGTTAGLWGSLGNALDTSSVLELPPHGTYAVDTDLHRRSVCWRWQFNNSRDTQDTTLGEAGTATMVVKIGVLVEQVD